MSTSTEQQVIDTKQAAAELSRPQRAAILIMSMGAEAAGQIFRHLEEEEVELLTALITEVSTVPMEVRAEVLEEFRTAMAEESGEDFELQGLLDRALGKDKAREILDKASSHRHRGELFGFCEDLDAKYIATSLRNEQPQTVALILAHLKPHRSAEILKHLVEARQPEIVRRIASMGKVKPSVVRRVDQALQTQLLMTTQDKSLTVGGTKMIAEILNTYDRETEKRILEDLQERNEEMVEEVKRLMLVFEDLNRLPDTSMQAILREVDMSAMALALKGASDNMKDLVYRNLSKRATERLKEEIELMGPKKRSEVNEAQQQVLAVARRLEEEGKISIRGTSGSDNELIE